MAALGAVCQVALLILSKTRLQTTVTALKPRKMLEKVFVDQDGLFLGPVTKSDSCYSLGTVLSLTPKSRKSLSLTMTVPNDHCNTPVMTSNNLLQLQKGMFSVNLWTIAVRFGQIVV
jgi:hypothetical protein